MAISSGGCNVFPDFQPVTKAQPRDCEEICQRLAAHNAGLAQILMRLESMRSRLYGVQPADDGKPPIPTPNGAVNELRQLLSQSEALATAAHEVCGELERFA